MALGIGPNTAVFSVVHAVLLRPLPYDSPDRIVTLNTAFLTSGQTQGLVSIANFRDWRDQSSSFDAMAAYRGGEYPVTPDRVAEYARAAVVDAGLLSCVRRGANPGPYVHRGRNVALQPRLLVNHDYWQRRLDADPDVLVVCPRNDCTLARAWPTARRNARFPGRLWATVSQRHGS